MSMSKWALTFCACNRFVLDDVCFLYIMEYFPLVLVCIAHYPLQYLQKLLVSIFSKHLSYLLTLTERHHLLNAFVEWRMFDHHLKGYHPTPIVYLTYVV